MNQLGASYFMYLENKRRHEELIEKAAQYRLVDDAVRAEVTKDAKHIQNSGGGRKRTGKPGG